MDGLGKLELTLLLIPSHKDAADADRDLELLKIRKFLLLRADIQATLYLTILFRSMFSNYVKSWRSFS